MKKKESYKHILPHFQQPGQAYFVTWSLKDAIPAKAIAMYSRKLGQLKTKIDLSKKFNGNNVLLAKMKREYAITRRKYFIMYDTLLAQQKNPDIDLSSQNLQEIIVDVLNHWDNICLENYAFCVMKNHVHWAFRVYEKDESGKSVYLQDILKSVKSFSARAINRVIEQNGQLWQKESYDTTIRNEIHLVNVVRYTLNNPVKAGYVENWKEWSGCWCSDEFLDVLS